MPDALWFSWGRDGMSDRRDRKTSDLDSTNFVSPTDEFVVRRGGGNYRAALSLLGQPLSAGRLYIASTDFDVAADGVTNDAPALQTALNTIGAAGGGTLLVSGVLAIGSTISHTYSNVKVVGVGSDITHSVGSQRTHAGAVFLWTGASGGTIYDMASPTGASAQIQSGGGISGVYFDGAVTAAYGLRVRSWRKGRFEDLFINECSTACLDLNVVSQLGEASDTQDCDFIRIGTRATSVSGDGVRLGSDYFGNNTSLNRFWGVRCRINAGHGVVLNNCDNNRFFDIVVISPVGGGNALVFNGSNVNTGVARSNTIYGMSSNNSAPIIMRGTTTFTNPSYDNRVFDIDKDNSTPLPTIETGATGYWSRTDGLLSHDLVRVRVGKQASDMSALPISTYANASMVVINGSNSGIVQATPSGNSAWICAVDTSNSDYLLTLSAGAAAAAVRGRRFKVGTLSTDPFVASGDGSPEGVLTAPVGSMYLRRDGGASTSMYVKESGTGNTGWVAK